MSSRPMFEYQAPADPEDRKFTAFKVNRLTARFRVENRAFTLIEILVVISLIGILASILAPHSTIYVTKSRDARVKEELANLRTALNAYVLVNNGKYPATLKELYPDFIKTLPVRWEGSKGRGYYALDAIKGTVYLADESGSTYSNELDSKGVCYGDY